jgi:hypothetical protein
MQTKRLDEVLVQNPSLNLPQGEAVDNRLQIINPIARLHRSEGSDEGDMMGKAKIGGQKDLHSAKPKS